MLADQFIRTGKVKNALVIGADLNSRHLDETDRSTVILFGDGAGAVILQASEQKESIISTHLHASADQQNLLSLPNTEQGNRQSGLFIYKVMKPLNWRVRELASVVEETLAANHLDKSEIDWLIPHQANLRIIAGTAKKLEMDMSRVVVTLDHAMSDAASIPVALDEAVRDGRIQRGQLLLLEGFGGGWTWGSALIRF